MNTTHLAGLDRICDLQPAIRDIHPLLERLYPVAIVEGDRFFIYVAGPDRQRYALVSEVPAPMPIPASVRAAFPLDSLNGQTACVVTPEVFDSLEGCVTVFHEFAHCHQAATCEAALRRSLALARRADEAGDMMWEINHPFPFDSPAFIEAYAAMLAACDAGDTGEIARCRSWLRRVLSAIDFEYLVWQEWKEGFARWMENSIRRRLDLPVNQGGRERPFSRVTFYAGGAALIAHLAASGELSTLDALFHRLRAW